jgi:hypothetical protein
VNELTDNIVEDPNWWPHRLDVTRGSIHYIPASRDDHRKAVFLTDEYLKGASRPKAIDLASAAGAGNQAPIHFIFHSAFCCSTLLARAFDLPGLSMGYKEPQILNDIVGWRQRGAKPEAVANVMSGVLPVLARSFEPDETVVIKSSNVVNGLAGLMMHLRPNSNAVFIYAPLRDFLGSIARKEMWGRLWVRDLLAKQIKEGLVNLGLQGDDYLKLTDLQAAAVGWLVQQNLFVQLISKYGSKRIKAIDSTALMSNPESAMRNLASLFQVSLTEEGLQDLVHGPVFTRHSKSDDNFDASSREMDRQSGNALHADEIEKVYTWAEAVAKNAGIPLALPITLV